MPISCFASGSSAKRKRTMACCSSSRRRSTRCVSKWDMVSKARSPTRCRRSSSQARSFRDLRPAIYSGGIERGVDGIISVLTGDAAEWHRKVNVRADDASADFNKLFPLLFFGLLFLVMWYLIRHAVGGPGSADRRSGVGPIASGGSWGWAGFGGGGSSGGGGFRRWIFRRRRFVGRRRRVGGLVMQFSKERTRGGFGRHS